jgi:hypothetical protein
MADSDSQLEERAIPEEDAVELHPCPLCELVLPASELEHHVRATHRSYTYRGQRRSFNDTLALVLADLSSPQADAEAWQALERLAVEEHGARAPVFLASTLGQLLSRAAHGTEGPASQSFKHLLTVLATLIANSATGPRVLPLLAAQEGVTVRRLGLGMTVLLPAAVVREVVASLQPLVVDKRLPSSERHAAAASLLRALGKSSRAAVDFLETLVSGVSKRRALIRLASLKKRLGSSSALKFVRDRLREQLRLRCPRCGEQLPRRQMRSHVWEQHRLVLHGKRVRQPFRLIADWLAIHQRTGNAKLLERCRQTAEQIDPVSGRVRVELMRLMLNGPEGESRRRHLVQLLSGQATLCPHCLGRVPQPSADRPSVPHLTSGRWTAQGYRVEIDESGFRPNLLVQTPQRVLYRGREPGHYLTWSGTVLFLVGPPIVAAVTLGALRTGLWPVLLFLLLSLTLYGLARFSLWQRNRYGQRVVRHAWRFLAPALHEAGYSAEDAAVLSSLALASVPNPRFRISEDLLHRHLKITERAVIDGLASPAQLAPLRRLALSLRFEDGHDPAEELAVQIGRCFEGKLPLALVQELLHQWKSSWWTRATLARLRVLLCDRAFEAGFEVETLRAAARAVPALGDVLDARDVEGLGQLRLLWSQRALRPWDRLGPAQTVFEVAARAPEEGLLERYPDLLLVAEFAEPPLGMDGSFHAEAGQLVLCGRGIAYLDKLIIEKPKEGEIFSNWDSWKRGYALYVGKHHFIFRGDPEHLQGHLERWVCYFFDDFLPQTTAAVAWPMPDPNLLHRVQGASVCPECHDWLIPRIGAIGTTLR